jgi:transposase
MPCRGELTASHVFVLDELLRHIEELEARIARFDARNCSPNWRASTMRSPCCKPCLASIVIGAAMLLVEIGSDMSVFGTPDRLASWVGLCPGNNESAGKAQSRDASARAIPTSADSSVSSLTPPAAQNRRSRPSSSR